MSRIKKIFLKIWQFISIFGLFIGLLFGYLGFLYARFAVGRLLSEHKIILRWMLWKTKPTIKEIEAVFGKPHRYYSDASGRKKLEEEYYFSKEIIEKFEQHPSMVFYGLPSVKYYIFFDKEGKMVDFYVEGQ